jgi:hypothetical protein
MNAHKLATTLTQDGTLVLQGLPFQAGDHVEIIIREQPPTNKAALSADHPLQTDELQGENASVTMENAEYLNAVTATLNEWESDADEHAYHSL